MLFDQLKMSALHCSGTPPVRNRAMIFMDIWWKGLVEVWWGFWCWKREEIVKIQNWISFGNYGVTWVRKRGNSVQRWYLYANFEYERIMQRAKPTWKNERKKLKKTIDQIHFIPKFELMTDYSFSVSLIYSNMFYLTDHQSQSYQNRFLPLFFKPLFPHRPN